MCNNIIAEGSHVDDRSIDVRRRSRFRLVLSVSLPLSNRVPFPRSRARRGPIDDRGSPEPLEDHGRIETARPHGPAFNPHRSSNLAALVGVTTLGDLERPAESTSTRDRKGLRTDKGQTATRPVLVLVVVPRRDPRWHRESCINQRRILVYSPIRIFYINELTTYLLAGFFRGYANSSREFGGSGQAGRPRCCRLSHRSRSFGTCSAANTGIEDVRFRPDLKQTNKQTNEQTNKQKKKTKKSVSTRHRNVVVRIRTSRNSTVRYTRTPTPSDSLAKVCRFEQWTL